MRGVGSIAILVTGLLAAGSASADWSGKGTFGGVLARGNTETETINLNIDVENVVDRWTHKAGASMLRTVTEDVTSADRWELRGESQYSLTERGYLFGALRYEDDAFTELAFRVHNGADLILEHVFESAGAAAEFFQSLLFRITYNPEFARGFWRAVFNAL